MDSIEVWVVFEGGEVVHRSVSYVPVLYKTFNVTDNKQRKLAVKVSIDVERRLIGVYNNGDGLRGIPEMIYGHLLTSSNYDDNVKKLTGGRNGYVAKLTNIFSTEFLIQTADDNDHKQVLSEIMGEKSEPSITKCRQTENWTDAKIQNMKKIFGLQRGKEYDSVKGLRYGHLMIMTDQASQRSGKVSFYIMPKYEARNESLSGNVCGWSIEYCKWLGTSTAKEGNIHNFRCLDMHEQSFVRFDKRDGEAIEPAFSKRNIDARKSCLKQNVKMPKNPEGNHLSAPKMFHARLDLFQYSWFHPYTAELEEEEEYFVTPGSYVIARQRGWIMSADIVHREILFKELETGEVSQIFLPDGFYAQGDFEPQGTFSGPLVEHETFLVLLDIRPDVLHIHYKVYSWENEWETRILPYTAVVVESLIIHGDSLCWVDEFATLYILRIGGLEPVTHQLEVELSKMIRLVSADSSLYIVMHGDEPPFRVKRVEDVDNFHLEEAYNLGGFDFFLDFDTGTLPAISFLPGEEQGEGNHIFAASYYGVECHRYNMITRQRTDVLACSDPETHDEECFSQWCF